MCGQPCFAAKQVKSGAPPRLHAPDLYHGSATGQSIGRDMVRDAWLSRPQPGQQCFAAMRLAACSNSACVLCRKHRAPELSAVAQPKAGCVCFAERCLNQAEESGRHVQSKIVEPWAGGPRELC